MTRFRTYTAMAFAIALVALSALVAPPAKAASTIHCESTGSGTFACETNAYGYLYYWQTSSNAKITQKQGKTASGTCTIGTKPTVTVTGYYPASSTTIGGTTPRAVTVSTAFTCSSVAL